MFCMILGGLCPSTNVVEEGKLSEKLLQAGPQFQIGVWSFAPVSPLT